MDILYCVLFIQSLADRHLGYFHSLAITSNAVVIHVQAFKGTYVLIYSVMTLLDHMVRLTVVINYQTVFQSDCTSLHSHQ